MVNTAFVLHTAWGARSHAFTRATTVDEKFPLTPMRRPRVALTMQKGGGRKKTNRSAIPPASKPRGPSQKEAEEGAEELESMADEDRRLSKEKLTETGEGGAMIEETTAGKQAEQTEEEEEEKKETAQLQVVNDGQGRKLKFDMEKVLEDIDEDEIENDDGQDSAQTKLSGDNDSTKLPELSKASGSKIKRRRKPRQSAAAKLTRKEKQDMQREVREKNLSLADIEEMTTAYRLGDAGAQRLIDELEREPDFVLKAAAESGEYDLTSALFGTGRPNKQGVYVLPYLQSAHIVILAISLLVTFVYYPGFPLTESTEAVRDFGKKALAVAFTVNGGLAVAAYKSAETRNQPPVFWALKTLILGELAFGELRRNTQVVQK